MLMLCALTHLIHTHARKRGVIGPARDIESIFHMVNNARVGLAFRKLQDFLSHGNSRVFSASFRPFQGGYAPLTPGAPSLLPRVRTSTAFAYLEPCYTPDE